MKKITIAFALMFALSGYGIAHGQMIVDLEDGLKKLDEAGWSSLDECRKGEIGGPVGKGRFARKPASLSGLCDHETNEIGHFSGVEECEKSIRDSQITHGDYMYDISCVRRILKRM
ncbi:MAG: hypothetical protein LBI17_00100 [Rickettsiales bacterium]|nr:hypothetical protein [Rickettsiales bacterium]